MDEVHSKELALQNGARMEAQQVLVVGPMQQRGDNRINQNNHESLCGAGARPFSQQSVELEREFHQVLSRCLISNWLLIMPRQTSSLMIGPSAKAFGMCDTV